jgi:hypothetical protein
VKSFLDGLEQRRAALAQRSAAQRRAIATSATEIRNASAAPAIIGASVAASLLASSPKLRDWALRGWAVYAFVRQLAGK